MNTHRFFEVGLNYFRINPVDEAAWGPLLIPQILSLPSPTMWEVFWNVDIVTSYYSYNVSRSYYIKQGSSW